MISLSAWGTTSYTRTSVDMDSTTSTTAAYPTNLTVTRKTRSVSTDSTSRIEIIQPRRPTPEFYKKLIQDSILQELMSSWVIKNEKITVPKRRPDIQLRGVCLNGLGWG